jgi:hypothetical protein
MVATLYILTLIWLFIPSVHSRRRIFLGPRGEPGNGRPAPSQARRYVFDWEKLAGENRPKLVAQNDKTKSQNDPTGSRTLIAD